MTWKLVVIYLDGTMDEYPGLSKPDCAHMLKFSLDQDTADEIKEIKAIQEAN